MQDAPVTEQGKTENQHDQNQRPQIVPPALRTRNGNRASCHHQPPDERILSLNRLKNQGFFDILKIGDGLCKRPSANRRLDKKKGLPNGRPFLVDQSRVK
jgi:hypothetical protein